MAVDKATVTHIAKLARIRITDAEAEALPGELSNIMSWVEQLAEVDTSDVAPMTSVVAVEPPMRDDVVNDGDCVADILANAPDADDAFFHVPKVVE